MGVCFSTTGWFFIVLLIALGARGARLARAELMQSMQRRLRRRLIADHRRPWVGLVRLASTQRRDQPALLFRAPGTSHRLHQLEEDVGIPLHADEAAPRFAARAVGADGDVGRGMDGLLSGHLSADEEAGS